MKNSYFSGAGFFTGAEIYPGTFMVRVRRATAEPPWLLIYRILQVVAAAQVTSTRKRQNWRIGNVYYYFKRKPRNRLV